jgi:type I restriction enzyme R subunit
LALLSELGWTTVNARDEELGSAGMLGRETTSEVVLVPRLRAALERLNPDVPPEGIVAAVDQLAIDRPAMGLAAANREIYLLLKEGVRVSVPDREHGGQREVRVRVIDWQDAANNDFLVASQFSITGALYTCRPDLIGFVINGLPLIVIELKKPGVPAKQAFDDNITSYKHDQNGVPALFWYNVLLIASNGTDSRVGSLTADWERFFEWKRVDREDEPRRVSLEVMLRGVAEPGRLLDLVENFTIFSEHKSGYVKILSQNHQFLGVNNAIASMLEARTAGHGRAGVFWQTQGSGKSLSMVFFAQKVLRRIPGNWTFVVVTDRAELDGQIARTFKETGAVSEADSKTSHAGTGAHLRQLLTENHRYVFTLIQKFQTPDRRDIVVLTDEAHRSQYDTLALNMRSALPNALFIAFTGTPLIAGEERTREVFGDYVSIYDFQQSVEDGATVRLFYENRTPGLRLKNPNFQRRDVRRHRGG